MLDPLYMGHEYTYLAPWCMKANADMIVTFRVGLALLDTVDEMVRDGSLSGDIANIIMSRVSVMLHDHLRSEVLKNPRVLVSHAYS